MIYKASGTRTRQYKTRFSKDRHGASHPFVLLLILRGNNVVGVRYHQHKHGHVGGEAQRRDQPLPAKRTHTNETCRETRRESTREGFALLHHIPH